MVHYEHSDRKAVRYKMCNSKSLGFHVSDDVRRLTLKNYVFWDVT
jgi:hypothetical protein